LFIVRISTCAQMLGVNLY